LKKKSEAKNRKQVHYMHAVKMHVWSSISFAVIWIMLWHRVFPSSENQPCCGVCLNTADHRKSAHIIRNCKF